MLPVRPPLEMLSTLGVGSDAPERAAKLTIPQQERRRALVVPREHGAWGMLLVPLVTGAAVGLLAGGRVAPVLLLTTAVLALFWLRTPIESWLGTNAVRVQTKQERRMVCGVILPLAMIAMLTLGALFWQGKNRELIWLGMIAGAVFATQMFLKGMGRTTRMAAEVVGALALTSTGARSILRGHGVARCESLGAVAGQLGVRCRLRLVCEEASANRASPARLDGTGSRADLRCAPHRRV